METASSVFKIASISTFRRIQQKKHVPPTLISHQRTRLRIHAVEEERESPKPQPKRADSTDVVASFLTRRFGIGAGLAWLGILAVGSLGEQIKTRLEVKRETEAAKEVQNAPTITLPSGVQYVDRKIGGGSSPYKGALTVIDLKGKVENEGSEIIFEDTFASGKSIAFLFGTRPLSDTLCVGLEEALKSMKAGGVRDVVVPPNLGYGSKGAVLSDAKGNEQRIPPNATLKYQVELKRVSIAP